MAVPLFDTNAGEMAARITGLRGDLGAMRAALLHAERRAREGFSGPEADAFVGRCAAVNRASPTWMVDGLQALERDARSASAPLDLPDIGKAVAGIVADLRSGAERLSIVNDAVRRADGTPTAVDVVVLPVAAVPKVGDGPGEPGGLPFVIGSPTPPHIVYDADFPGDPEAPGPEDHVSRAKWEAMLRAGQGARPDLDDATALYQHYLGGSGEPVRIDYEEAAREDEHVRATIDAQVRSAGEHADRLLRETGRPDLSITGDAVSAGDLVDGYPTATENWQKTLGGYNVWSTADVHVEGNRVTMTVTVNAEDRYNFNAGAADIATGAPDSENVRFAKVGWAKGFMVTGSVTRTVSWTLGDPPSAFAVTGAGEPERNVGREDREDERDSGGSRATRPGSDPQTGGPRAG
jgi:hypothetical protein